LFEKETAALKKKLSLYPTLPVVASAEVFGLIPSQHTSTFGGLLTIKEEPDDEDGDMILGEIEARSAEINHQLFVEELGVDLGLLLLPERPISRCASPTQAPSTKGKLLSDTAALSGKGKRKAILDPEVQALDAPPTSSSTKRARCGSISVIPEMDISQTNSLGQTELVSAHLFSNLKRYPY
jgi:hypothetical protein